MVNTETKSCTGFGDFCMQGLRLSPITPRQYFSNCFFYNIHVAGFSYVFLLLISYTVTCFSLSLVFFYRCTIIIHWYQQQWVIDQLIDLTYLQSCLSVTLLGVAGLTVTPLVEIKFNHVKEAVPIPLLHCPDIIAAHWDPRQKYVNATDQQII